MREIKFRVWNKLEQKMYDYAHDAYDYMSDVPATCFGQILEETNEWDVMQYIGIKDKNGKEIYEGDIVLCERNIAPLIDKYTYVVGWNAEDARYNFTYKDGWSEIDACDHIFTEVIGNIYENPELLEVK